MGADTKIEWADDSVNFWWGCTQISPGCDHCYAKEIAERFSKTTWNGGPLAERVGRAVVELRAIDRRAAKEGRKRFVFINSMSDTFDNRADGIWRRELFRAIEACTNVVALVLTKRVGNVIGMVEYDLPMPWPRNAWLGATVVNQEEADRDLQKLLGAKHKLAIPKVFLSIEPMLGPVDLTQFIWRAAADDALPGGAGWRTDVAAPMAIDWVICGGESGRGARPMHPDWARSLRDQCAAAGVPFFYKQHGEWIPGEVYAIGDSLGHARHQDGLPHPGKLSHWWSGDAGGGVISTRVGRAKAGRLLDGVEHNGRPQ